MPEVRIQNPEKYVVSVKAEDLTAEVAEGRGGKLKSWEKNGFCKSNNS
jgi:hypothetical protein